MGGTRLSYHFKYVLMIEAASFHHNTKEWCFQSYKFLDTQPTKKIGGQFKSLKKSVKSDVNGIKSC